MLWLTIALIAAAWTLCSLTVALAAGAVLRRSRLQSTLEPELHWSRKNAPVRAQTHRTAA